jgi:hypothetical protein
VLTLNLTGENAAYFESMPFAEVISYLEKLDDAYYAAVPDLPALAAMYGDKNGVCFYSERDLYLTYQRRYIREHGLSVTDMNNECGCFSRRF